MNAITFDKFINAAYRSPNMSDELVLQGDSIHLASGKVSADVRKRTWEAFHQAVKAAVGSERRFERICNRYGFKNLGEMSDLPFRRRYVEIFGVGLANLQVCDLEEKHHSKQLHTLSNSELHDLYTSADSHRYLGPINPPRELRGGPKEPWEYFIYDPFPQDRKRLNLYAGIEKLRAHQHSYLQRLSMAIVSHEMEPGTIVPAPGKYPGELDYYKVHDVIAGKGLYALALVPVVKQSDLKPLLLFRPTQTSLGAIDAIDTLRNNAQEFTGELGYVAAKEKLTRLMNDPTFTLGKKIDVASYSLGGAHGGYFVRDHAHEIDQAVFFNAVSNSDPKVAEETAKTINAMPIGTRPKFYIYRAVTEPGDKIGKKGDWAHFLGEKSVGWDCDTLVEVWEFYIHDKPTPKTIREWGDLHGVRFLDSEDDPLNHYRATVYRGKTLVNQQLNNKCRGEEIARFEEMRRTLGSQIFYHVISFFYKLLNFFFSFFGIHLIRTSDE